jgi:hypothetical protein
MQWIPERSASCGCPALEQHAAPPKPLVWLIVTTFVAALPLFIAFLFVDPPAGPRSSPEKRESVLELRLYASSSKPLAYDRSEGFPISRDRSIFIPNHLRDAELVS